MLHVIGWLREHLLRVTPWPSMQAQYKNTTVVRLCEEAPTEIVTISVTRPKMWEGLRALVNHSVVTHNVHVIGWLKEHPM